MQKNVFKAYVDAVSDSSEICVVVRSVETGGDIAATYDIVADIGEYGELVISVEV